MAAGAIKAGAAYVELLVNNSGLVRGLKHAQARLNAFGSSVRGMGLALAGVGGAAVTGLLGAAKHFSETGDAVAKMSKRTGVSVEALSELNFTAGQSGTDIESLENGLRKMQNTIFDAGKGTKTAVDALAALGLAVADLEGLKPEEQFMKLAEAVSRVPDPTTRAALAMDVFGRTGTGLLPMFEQGAAGIRGLMEEARRLGLTISTEDAKAGEVFNDALGRLWATLKQGVFLIGASLGPSLSKLADYIMRVVVESNKWVNENRQTVITVLKVASAVAIAGGALVVFGAGVNLLASVIGGITTAVTFAASMIGILGSALGGIISILGAAVGAVTALYGILSTTTVIGALTAAIAGLGTVAGAVVAGISAAFAALLSPIGLAAAAVIGFSAVILHQTGAIGKNLSWLGDGFRELKSIGVETWQGISDALATGDIGLAAKIAWQGIVVAWKTGVHEILGIWLGLKEQFFSITNAIGYGMLETWENTVAAFKEIVFSGIAAIMSKWNQFQDWLARGMLKVAGAVNPEFDSEEAIAGLRETAKGREAKAGTELETKLAGIEQERLDTLAAIAAAHEGEARERADRYADELLASEKALAAARAEWRASVKAAAEKRAAVERPQPTEEGPPPGPSPWEGFDPGPSIEKVTASIDALSYDVAGTFNAMALQGLQGGISSTEERTADAAERTAVGVEKLLFVAANNDGGLSFSP